MQINGGSPSARKVWIEMDHQAEHQTKVAKSPSARKVWIEIQFDSEIDVEVLAVTFREEGVD